jgi:phosphatidylserine synthase 2
VWIDDKHRHISTQTLIVRDAWMCLMQSILFEFIEYSLEHQMANFQVQWMWS